MFLHFITGVYVSLGVSLMALYAVFHPRQAERPPLKRNGYRPIPYTVTYKTKISCLTWSLNKVTVFYLSEGRVDVSWEELAPNAPEEMSVKINKETTHIQGLSSVSIRIQ